MFRFGCSKTHIIYTLATFFLHSAKIPINRSRTTLGAYRILTLHTYFTYRIPFVDCMESFLTLTGEKNRYTIAYELIERASSRLTTIQTIYRMDNTTCTYTPTHCENG